MWYKRLCYRICMLYKRVLIKSKEKLDKLYDEKWELEAAVRKVNDETKVIKYDNIPQEIYIKVMGIAEDNNIDASDSSDLEWKIKEVREKVNELESAIYDLVEPFEDALRDKDNEIDELEYELEEEVA